MKDLYFLRHGEADWPDWDAPDDERPLTDKGKAEMRRVAKLLEKIGAAPDLIVTSPLPRAAQTAEIVAERLGVSLAVDDLVSPGFDVEDLARLARKHAIERLMVVGHEPDFSSVIRAVTGAHIKMAKGGAALVRVNGPVKRGVLHWLFPPKFSKLV